MTATILILGFAFTALVAFCYGVQYGVMRSADTTPRQRMYFDFSSRQEVCPTCMAAIETCDCAECGRTAETRRN